MSKNIERLTISSTAMYYESMLTQAANDTRQRFYETAIDPDAKAWPVLVDLSSKQVLFVGAGLLDLLGISFADALTNGGASLVNLPGDIGATNGTSCQTDKSGKTITLKWHEVTREGKLKYYEVYKGQ